MLCKADDVLCVCIAGVLRCYCKATVSLCALVLLAVAADCGRCSRLVTVAAGRGSCARLLAVVVRVAAAAVAGTSERPSDCSSDLAECGR